MLLKPVYILLLAFTFILVKPQAQELYKDTSQPFDVRVKDLISQMTLTEKIAQLGNNSPAISRLGVSSYNYWSEALHGVARSGLATSFPQVIGLSSTWNPELIFQVATAISDEARVKNNTENKGLTYWSPTINMARDPRWGRSEETYGEDPFLTSILATNFVRGMQGNDPYQLKDISNVNIEFYSVLGQLAGTKNFVNQNPGSHQVQIDFTEMKLKKGLYLVRFKTNDFSKSTMIEILDK